VTRIIGGSARGRRLRTPSGSNTRPTADRVREALFSALESELGTLAGIRFLDLFAGSGAVGLEARSRGASSVVLVESDRSAAALIRANAAELGLDGIEVHTGTAERWLAADGPEPFDVVYADPPYAMKADSLADLLAKLVANQVIRADGLAVVERSRRGEPWVWPDALEGLREKRYGDTMLFYGKPNIP
jgi:16S rRNA (guanine966-N2)-methyltransferase